MNRPDGHEIGRTLTRNERDMNAALYNCSATVAQLIEEGHIEQIFTEEEIEARISAYLDEHEAEILEFLGDDGKILVPMNSAEKFADIVVERLGISRDRVTKFKVSTYKEGISIKQLLRQSDKDALIDEMSLVQGDRILILEDLIDTGHTLRILYDFLFGKMLEVRALCLLDKHVKEGDKVKTEMGERLQSIIDVEQEFVIGFGMDFEERLCADMEGLWKIKEDSKQEVIETLNIFVDKIRHILQRPDAN